MTVNITETALKNQTIKIKCNKFITHSNERESGFGNVTLMSGANTQIRAIGLVTSRDFVGIKTQIEALKSGCEDDSTMGPIVRKCKSYIRRIMLAVGALFEQLRVIIPRSNVGLSNFNYEILQTSRRAFMATRWIECCTERLVYFK